MTGKKGFFVTGTGTGIGKTVCSALLVSSHSTSGGRVGYWKPVQTGQDSDTATVLKLTGLAPESAPPPRYEFPEPVAPARAATLNQTSISLEEIRHRWERLPSDRFWIVEGAGGLLVPLQGRQTMADLILQLGLPVIVVAGTALGTMNHLLLTLEALDHRSIPVGGIAWVGDEDPALAPTLSPWLERIPFQCRVPFFPIHGSEEFQAAAQQAFSGLAGASGGPDVR